MVLPPRVTAFTCMEYTIAFFAGIPVHKGIPGGTVTHS